MRDRFRRRARFANLLAITISLAGLGRAAADEGGASFWLPGQYASFAAMPYSSPGWAAELIYYHATAKAGGNFQRSGSLQFGVDTPSDFVMFTPTYVFETPVFGAQASVGLTALFGRNKTSVSATLTGPDGTSLSGTASDQVVGFGDLSPTASLAWTGGVHNAMTYVTANIPVGAYSMDRSSALGLGYWVVDAGAGYTYMNEQAGLEWSAVLGFSYNFTNPHTQYQSGIDAHLDWAISPYVSDTMHVGVAGYFYQQVTGDSGPGAVLGDFKSRVAGIGPQIGFFFPVADRQAYLNVRGYHEFDAQHRPDGWTGWITLSLEPPERPRPAPIRRR